MNLCVVTIFGGLLCSQVLGNPQLKHFKKDQIDLHSNKIIHISGESSANEKNGLPNSGDESPKLKDKTTNADVSSMKQNKSSTPNTDKADSQNPGNKNSGDNIDRVKIWRPKFEVLGKPPTTDIPSNDPDVGKPSGCPCTYSKLRTLVKSLRNAEYVLEDVLLYLRRTRKLEEFVSSTLSSIDRLLRGKSALM
ncbi:hypothetical protein X801_04942 [Opisthorchis viverrini]|uniref:Uncharacterized protein n=1 Tax=Opisthorchis viverrini TaxID=6198 RepID=A0A1S8WXT0_OPIVI|nr:hypothetical protein X801_04942 [Opisthorchis viverrini]